MITDANLNWGLFFAVLAWFAFAFASMVFLVWHLIRKDIER